MLPPSVEQVCAVRQIDPNSLSGHENMLEPMQSLEA